MRHEVTRRALAGMTALIATTLLSATMAAQTPASTSGQTSGSAAPAQPSQPQPGTAPKRNVQFARRIPVTYDNRWEVYGGLNFMNGQAGQNLPKRYNMGGVEGQATYWLTDRIGPAVDLRVDYGTTPVFPNTFQINRPVVRQIIGMGGVQYRGWKNQRFAIQYHGLVGVGAGKFDGGTLGGINAPSHNAAANAVAVGLYSNRVKPVGAFGGSLDINGSYRWAIRLQPDLIVEHYGTEYREFVSISGGVVWRFGHRQ
ncbi:hypothetical protein AB4Y89_16695 [Terriglobus sp. 2YAB30_2]|uniref:hypothetical protein n=1 Tax=Terriglobus sp. 2YAB30_2 TaxID=3233023 RepID=UPI003F9E853C